MGGKDIVRRSALALGLTLAIGGRRGEGATNRRIGHADLRCAGLVGRGSRNVLHHQPGLALDPLCLVQGAQAHRRR